MKKMQIKNNIRNITLFLMSKVVTVVLGWIAFYLSGKLFISIKLLIILLLLELSVILAYRFTKYPAKFVLKGIKVLTIGQLTSILVSYYITLEYRVFICGLVVITSLILFVIFRRTALQWVNNLDISGLVQTVVIFTALGLIIKILAFSIFPEILYMYYQTILVSIPCEVASTGAVFTMLMMGNATSQGIRTAATSSTQTLGQRGVAARGAPIRYSDEFIREFKRYITIQHMNDKDAFMKKYGVSPKSIFNHYWVVSDDKTKAHTLTKELPGNINDIKELEISDNLVNGERRKQYIHPEGIETTPKFVDEKMHQTPAGDKFEEKNREKLIEKIEKASNKYGFPKNAEKEYEKITKNGKDNK